MRLFRRLPARTGSENSQPPRRARRLRTAEVALGILGISLLAMAGFSRLNASRFQAEQGRVFSKMERLAGDTSPAPLPASHPPSAANSIPLWRVEIPRVGISAFVSEGVDDKTLALAVGHIPGTARPGEIGNMALAGHRDSFFRNLEHIRLRDTIEFRTPFRSDRYRVTSMAVVSPTDLSVLEPTDQAVLTLVTCYPFSWIGEAPNRFVVRATKIWD